MSDVVTFDIMPEFLKDYEDAFMDDDFPDLHIDFSQVMNGIDSNSKQEDKMLVITDKTAIAEDVNMPSGSDQSRFGKVGDDKIGELFDARHSKSTKSNTAWAIKIFNGMLSSINIFTLFNNCHHNLIIKLRRVRLPSAGLPCSHCIGIFF